METITKSVYERAIESCNSRIEDREFRGLNEKRIRTIEVQEYLLAAANFFHASGADEYWKAERTKIKVHEFIDNCIITLEPILPFKNSGFYAKCSEFPNLVGKGDTPNDAVLDLKEHLVESVTIRLECGLGV